MHMHTDLKFMTVMQWMSPAFPIGAFAYSHGLEWAIDKDHVSNGEKLQKWITDLLEYGSLRTDAIFISLILRGHDVRKMNELSMALCPAGERLLETKLQGSAFAKVIEDVWQQDIGELSLPIAVALAAKNQSIEQDLILPAYLHAFCSNLISVRYKIRTKCVQISW